MHGSNLSSMDQHCKVRLPSWILLLVKNDLTARCGLSMSTTMPNFVPVSQPAAELLRFVEKFKILNLYFAILDHPRSPLMDLKSHSKFGVNRISTFSRYCDFKILKIWLKTPIQAPNLRSGGLTPKCYFSLLGPQKGTSLAGNTRFEPSLVAVRRAVRPGR